MTGKQLLRGLAYVENELARPGLSPEHRERLERQSAAYKHRTQGLCRRCGKKLDDLDSIARGFGPECIRHVTVAEAEGWWSPADEQDDAADAGAYDDVTPDRVAWG